MMDKSPDRLGSVSISKYIRAGCSDCQDLFELSELREVFAGLRSFRRAHTRLRGGHHDGRLGPHCPPIIGKL